MKVTIKKVKNYNFGQGVIRDTYFIRIWDKYGWLLDNRIGGFTKEEAKKIAQEVRFESGK